MTVGGEQSEVEQTDEDQVFSMLTKIHGDDPFTQIVNRNTTSRIAYLLKENKEAKLLSSIKDAVQESWGYELAAWHTAKAILLITGRGELIPEG